MADKVRQQTEKRLAQLEREIQQVYAQAAREIKQKMDTFARKHKAKDERLRAEVAAGKITEAAYQSWLRGQVFQGDLWEERLERITRDYMNADKRARELVGETEKKVFQEAANEQARQTKHDLRGAVSFTLYDRATVNRILREHPKLLPKYKIDQPKDYTWNEKRVRNVILQGILQGESVYKIARRLSTELKTSNISKMQMFARTAITGAENAGRIDRMRQTAEQGVRVFKEWSSVGDDRVRDAHVELDGQSVEYDKPFQVDGEDIYYPGDPDASLDLTYNCRCTLLFYYPDHQRR